MKRLYIIFCFLGFLFSCKKEKEIFPTGSNEIINQWIWETMNNNYFWNQEIPKKQKSEQDPQAYFYSLLSKQDFFSTIIQNQNEGTYGYSMENTFGFDFINYTSNKDEKNVVNLVVPGSSADQLGLKRGDLLLTINQKDIIQHKDPNFKEYFKSNSLQVLRSDGKIFQIPSASVAQPVIYHSTVLQKNIRIYGYLYLSHFNFSGSYDLIKVVENFKVQGVNELILDLRYNPGGQVSFAAFLSLLIAKLDSKAVFIKLKGNQKIGQTEKTFEDILAQQPNGYTFNTDQLQNEGLGLSKIFILCSGQTASASELLINNLKPYIEVISIGENSMGKDMSSIVFRSPKELLNEGQYSWLLQPLVYKLYNAKDQGDYTTGINPTLVVDEFSKSKLYPFGSTEDPLIEKVVNMGDGNKVNLNSQSKLLDGKKSGSNYWKIMEIK